MINKAALMRQISKATKFSLRDSSTCIDVIFDAITDAISRGEKIELRGFGTFFIRQISPKTCHSSFSAQSIIPSHGRIVFRPCQKLRLSAWNRVKE
ncbi:MAG: HU family DNA-binding protein [Treponema sp.]|nr:HU family DNA-binding protein [Treponema sp.]